MAKFFSSPCLRYSTRVSKTPALPTSTRPGSRISFSLRPRSMLRGRSEKLILEPGRVLVGNAGVLLTRVEYLKHGEEKNFAIVDAAMNDLMRPALYDAYHSILPVKREKYAMQSYEVVGPICETGDFIGHARDLPIAPQSLLAVLSAGAYGMSMSSNYNTRPRAAEVMVDGGVVHLVREREVVAQLYAGEKLIV